MVRIHFHPTIWINARLEISGLLGLLSSQNAAKEMRIFAPSPARCRKMLCELHQHLQLPVEAFAALLGIPRITLRKWLSGERQPSGAAKRLIWVLHCAIFDPAALRKLDGWLKWSGSHTEALEQFIEDHRQPADSGAVISAPVKKTICHGPSTIQIRKLRSEAKLGQHLGGDIHHIGITMLVQAAMKVSQTIAECEASLALDGLAVELRIELMRLKGEFLAQQMSIAKEMLELKRDRFAPTDEKPLTQTAFGPREQVYPATHLRETLNVSNQAAVSSDARRSAEIA